MTDRMYLYYTVHYRCSCSYSVCLPHTCCHACWRLLILICIVNHTLTYIIQLMHTTPPPLRVIVWEWTVMGIARKYIPQQATANQTLSSVSTLISRASFLIHIQCTSTLSQPKPVWSLWGPLHTRDVTTPSLMLESVYVHLSLAPPPPPTSHPLSPLDQQARSQPQRWLHFTDDVMGDSLLSKPFIPPLVCPPAPPPGGLVSSPLYPWPPSFPQQRAWPLPHLQVPLHLPPLFHKLHTSPCQTKACKVITLVTSAPPSSYGTCSLDSLTPYTLYVPHWFYTPFWLFNSCFQFLPRLSRHSSPPLLLSPVSLSPFLHPLLSLVSTASKFPIWKTYPVCFSIANKVILTSNTVLWYHLYRI